MGMGNQGPSYGGGYGGGSQGGAKGGSPMSQGYGNNTGSGLAKGGSPSSGMNQGSGGLSLGGPPSSGNYRDQFAAAPSGYGQQPSRGGGGKGGFGGGQQGNGFSPPPMRGPQGGGGFFGAPMRGQEGGGKGGFGGGNSGRSHYNGMAPRMGGPEFGGSNGGYFGTPYNPNGPEFGGSNGGVFRSPPDRVGYGQQPNWVQDFQRPQAPQRGLSLGGRNNGRNNGINMYGGHTGGNMLYNNPHDPASGIRPEWDPSRSNPPMMSGNGPASLAHLPEFRGNPSMGARPNLPNGGWYRGSR